MERRPRTGSSRADRIRPKARIVGLQSLEYTQVEYTGLRLDPCKPLIVAI